VVAVGVVVNCVGEVTDYEDERVSLLYSTNNTKIAISSVKFEKHKFLSLARDAAKK